MSLRVVAFLGVALSLGFGAVAVEADRPAVPAVTLAEARTIAFAKNWDLLAARADVDIATAQKLVAGEIPNPVLALSVTKVPADNSPSATSLGNGLFHRSYDTIAAFNQLVEIGGKRSARKASAAAGIEGAKARFADARRQLDLAVARGYVAVLLADEQARVLRASAGSLRQEAGIAETRLTAGDISRADRDQIAITADRIELDAGRAEAEARTARLQIEVLLGITGARGEFSPAESLVQLADRSTATDRADSGSRPVADRPDVVAARAGVAKAEADLRLQRAQRIPDPTLLVQYEREPPDKTDSVGLGVSFPLPLWNRNRGNIAAASATRDQAALRARQAEAVAAAEVSAAGLGLVTASERRARYAGRIVPGSAAITTAMRYAYQKGGASLLDLLTAERNDNDVRLAAAAAAADVANAAAALEAALGPISALPTPSKRP